GIRVGVDVPIEVRAGEYYDQRFGWESLVEATNGWVTAPCVKRDKRTAGRAVEGGCQSNVVAEALQNPSVAGRRDPVTRPRFRKLGSNDIDVHAAVTHRLHTCGNRPRRRGGLACKSCARCFG